MTSKLVRCTRCKCVSFAMARTEVMAEIASFNTCYDGLDESAKAAFGNRSTIDRYTCLCGGSNFIPAADGDVPDGATINGVLYNGDAAAT